MVWLTYQVVFFVLGLLALTVWASYQDNNSLFWLAYVILMMLGYCWWIAIHLLPTLALLVRRFNHVGCPKRFILLGLLYIIPIGHYLGIDYYLFWFANLSIVALMTLLFLDCWPYRKQKSNA